MASRWNATTDFLANSSAYAATPGSRSANLVNQTPGEPEPNLARVGRAQSKKKTILLGQVLDLELVQRSHAIRPLR